MRRPLRRLRTHPSGPCIHRIAETTARCQAPWVKRKVCIVPLRERLPVAAVHSARANPIAENSRVGGGLNGLLHRCCCRHLFALTHAADDGMYPRHVMRIRRALASGRSVTRKKVGSVFSVLVICRPFVGWDEQARLTAPRTDTNWITALRRGCVIPSHCCCRRLPCHWRTLAWLVGCFHPSAKLRGTGQNLERNRVYPFSVPRFVPNTED